MYRRKTAQARDYLRDLKAEAERTALRRSPSKQAAEEREAAELAPRDAAERRASAAERAKARARGAAAGCPRSPEVPSEKMRKKKRDVFSQRTMYFCTYEGNKSLSNRDNVYK